MVKSERSDELHLAFIEALEELGAKVETMERLSETMNVPFAKEMFRSWSKAGREVIFVRGAGFVNVHVRSDTKGFWGITKALDADFAVLRKELGVPCWYVLLVERRDRRGANGYILEDLESPPIIKRPSETAAQLKINEGTNLDKDKIVRSLAKVASAMLERGRERYGSSLGK